MIGSIPNTNIPLLKLSPHTFFNPIDTDFSGLSTLASHWYRALLAGEKSVTDGEVQ